MRFDLLVQGAPLATGAPERALKFARAAIGAGHRVGRMFFYDDGVSVANRFAADESGVRTQLAQLAAQAHFELAVCVTAAGRRGIRAGESLADGFVIVGLGQLIEAIEESDRLVSF
ncbi:MAG: sulfurtransferase complex subunit TusD [Gammaproteobacteria bacterium]|nr:sulfurtransferase complex subunit TusD [Gammaproteobacteria bacterium]